MKKRYRRKHAKPGELLAYYGKADSYGDPDLCYAWGEGCQKADSRLVDYALHRKDYDVFGTYHPSFIEELEKRGYDITTLKFSIKKK